MTMRGVIYCATSKIEYLESALISAIALRQLEPSISITLLSDNPSIKLMRLDDYKITPRLIEASELNHHTSFSSREIKTRLSTFSPYQETLYLDADILPLKPIGELWNYILKGDMAITPDRHPTVALCGHICEEEKNYTLEYIPESATQFNTGVILWKDSIQTQSLFEQWYQEWLKFKKQDQLALVRAIHNTKFSINKLPSIYNVCPIDAEPVLTQKPLKILLSGQKIDHIHQEQLEAALRLKQKNNGVCLLHCWGGLVEFGKFRQIAQEFYPDIVKEVSQLIK